MGGCRATGCVADHTFAKSGHDLCSIGAFRVFVRIGLKLKSLLFFPWGYSRGVMRIRLGEAILPLLLVVALAAPAAAQQNPDSDSAPAAAGAAGKKAKA